MERTITAALDHFVLGKGKYIVTSAMEYKRREKQKLMGTTSTTFLDLLIRKADISVS